MRGSYIVQPHVREGKLVQPSVGEGKLVQPCNCECEEKLV